MTQRPAGQLLAYLPQPDPDALAELLVAFANSEGGTVVMPFEPVPWGATFGMCVDRFGTPWMVSAATPPEG